MAVRFSFGAGLCALALGVLVTVAGCNSGNGETWESIVTTRVLGSVGDGPIVNARVRVFTNSGDLLDETRSTSAADYAISVSARSRDYPLMILADEGTDLVTNAPPDFTLVSLVMAPGSTKIANLNPYGTLIVMAARESGTLDETSIAEATRAVVRFFGFGLDPDLVADPISTPVDAANVHVIVKASETLGEMIRRTRDALIIAGTWIDGDGVVEALAADLVDGWVDGRGAAASDPRIAAIANVATAAVMMEAMANQLHVYGIDATDAMDQAIRLVRPGATWTTRDVAIPGDALAQTARALQAVTLVNGDRRVAQALQAVRDASPGGNGMDALPSEVKRVLHDAIQATAYISDLGQLHEINRIASHGGSSDSRDRSSGTATVSWSAPDQRENGDALYDLAGYRVYYGQHPTSLTQVIDLGDPRATRQLIENLDVGTWYFAVTAYCSKGLESDKSKIGSKTIH
jgi:hypothetical protein